MRTYKLKSGTRAEFVEIFRTRSMPAHREIGMKILGPFLSVEDPDVFFFMRAFPDLESREPMKAQFYEGELWKGELEAKLMPMIREVRGGCGGGRWRPRGVEVVSESTGRRWPRSPCHRDSLPPG
jgi:hypothetical protein